MQAANMRDNAAKVAKAIELDPDLELESEMIDWVRAAWQKIAPSRSYSPRQNGLGDPLPSFCLKIPTGGGKTLLATKVINLVNHHYRRQNIGLVLWIVPTTQIYDQTLKALKDRDHPYRQQLDMASGGRTLVLEKTHRFTVQDTEERLCVLLLMLPSANRQTKESLRIFQDSGRFDCFFPSEDDLEAHKKLLQQVPNLDVFDTAGRFGIRQIKSSLGNTLRLLRPLIILDEGHKAYSKGAKATLEGFNPYMIVELSATPPQNANVLVDISGQDLNEEEMIKLDLHIINKASASWQDTLLASIEHRNALEERALEHMTETGEYIRPICLIQVERTGKDQRGADFIHADDVRDYLLTHPGISIEHIAVKTSTQDQLKEVDEVGGLLSRDCSVRYIITKQALQEGWDCAFAYVLAILTNPSSRNALTQLVGRILRQPYAKKTGIPELDESYVFCFQRRGGELLNEVRKGFGLEGLQELEGRITQDTEDAFRSSRSVVAQQRDMYRQAALELVLPAFMVKDNGYWRLAHYEEDILLRVPWTDVDITPLVNLNFSQKSLRDTVQRTGLDTDARSELETIHIASNGGMIDYYFAASHLRDVVPNPWRSAGFAQEVFEALLSANPREHVVANFMFVLEELRKRLEAERDRLSKQVFADLLDSGDMRFIVVTDDLGGFNRFPNEIEMSMTKQANREDGSQYQHSLFDRIDEADLNGFENKVATYIDTQARMFFWYRNRARRDYYVQGWKPRRIYADFIFALRSDEPNVEDEYSQIFVMETKGVHLKLSEDTDYKRSVFNICSEHAQKRDWAEYVSAMSSKSMRFEVVDQDEWEQKLNTMFA